jgi:CO/xanthine dehydrogenase Mo-binding subunit
MAKLVGQNYSTPDLIAKVTGRSKYSEDFRVDGMLFAKLLLSPLPHARVTRLDTSAALAMPGVKAILTADDLPQVVAGQSLGEGIVASARGLTMEPLYQGEPAPVGTPRQSPDRGSTIFLVPAAFADANAFRAVSDRPSGRLRPTFTVNDPSE